MSADWPPERPADPDWSVVLRCSFVLFFPFFFLRSISDAVPVQRLRNDWWEIIWRKYFKSKRIFVCFFLFKKKRKAKKKKKQLETKSGDPVRPEGRNRETVVCYFLGFFFLFWPGFLPSLTAFYLVWLGLTEFYRGYINTYRVLLGFTGFYWVLPGLTGFYLVLLGFTGFDWVLQRLYQHLPGFTGFYLVLLGSTGFYWVLRGLDG